MLQLALKLVFAVMLLCVGIHLSPLLFLPIGGISEQLLSLIGYMGLTGGGWLGTVTIIQYYERISDINTKR